MTPPLFLLDPLPNGDEAVLDGDEGRHAARVRRIRTGERVLIGDGRGRLLDCTVTNVHAGGLTLRVDDRRDVPAPQPRFEVVQGLVKGDRGELAVELMTELGVDIIVPWAAARAVALWRDDRAAKGIARWQRTAAEAAKQSRRAWLPEIAQVHNTSEALARGAAARIVLHEAASARLSQIPLPESGVVSLIVGPEGGLTDDEAAAFEAAGGVCARLGDPVLRTSTAGAAALAALSVRLGRW